MASNPDGLLAMLLGNAGQGYNGMQQVQQDQQVGQLRQQQIQGNALQLQGAQAAQQQQQMFQQDTAAWVKRGSRADELPDLAARYPDQAKALQESWKMKSDAEKQADRSFFGQTQAALSSGSVPVALRNMRQRREAEAAARRDTAELDYLIDRVEKGGEDGLSEAKASMLAHLYSDDPDKYAQVFGIGKDKTHVINPGGALVDDTGKELYKSGEKPTYEKIRNADGTETLVAVGGVGASAPSGGGGQPLTARLNNPGAIRFSPNNDWQGQVGQEGGFAKFATPEAGAAAHRKLIANQIKAGYDTPLEWAKHYAPASDGNDPTAYASTVAKGLGIGINDKIPMSAVSKMASLSAGVESGGTPAPQGGSGARALFTSQGGKPGYRFLTPQEKEAQGLPTDVAFQMSPDGKVEAPTGQGKATQQAKSIPDGTAKRVQGDVSNFLALDTSLKSFKPDFGGHSLTGGLSNTMQAYLGTGPEGQRDWWANFYQTDNQIRNGLFGSALTDGEKKAYEATSISPAMDPKQIQKNLGRRAGLIKTALARQQRFLKANKYDGDAVDALFDVSDPLAQPAAPTAPAASAFKVLRVRPK